MSIVIDFNAYFDRFTVDQESEKAWKIKGQWFPKSGFNEDVSEWTNTIDGVSTSRSVSYSIKPWFFKKMNFYQRKALDLAA